MERDQFRLTRHSQTVSVMLRECEAMRLASRTRCSVLPAMRSIVRSRCTAEPGPKAMRSAQWTPDQQRTAEPVLWPRGARTRVRCAASGARISHREQAATWSSRNSSCSRIRGRERPGHTKASSMCNLYWISTKSAERKIRHPSTGIQGLASGRNCPRSGPARLVAHNDIYFVVQSVQAPNQTID